MYIELLCLVILQGQKYFECVVFHESTVLSINNLLLRVYLVFKGPEFYLKWVINEIAVLPKQYTNILYSL